MQKPPNTAAQSPALHLLRAMVEGPSESIENMERKGGAAMLLTDVLPVEVAGGDDAPFIALGFVFGEPFPDDPLFRPAQLPAGWSKKAGDNPYGYWTVIVDEHGVERASIFYKAAFYDRSAMLHLRIADRRP